MELGIVLKGPLSLPRQFLLRNKSQNIKELICQANTPLVRSVIIYIPIYPAHCQHQPEVSPLSIIIYLLLRLQQTDIDKMLLKAVSTTPGPSSSNDASMAKIQDSQIVTIGQLREIMEQINQNQEAFNNKLKSIGTNAVKLLAVK